jgi:hypothetical protein
MFLLGDGAMDGVAREERWDGVGWAFSIALTWSLLFGGLDLCLLDMELRLPSLIYASKPCFGYAFMLFVCA